jgi:hypothetical protein
MGRTGSHRTEAQVTVGAAIDIGDIYLAHSTESAAHRLLWGLGTCSFCSAQLGLTSAPLLPQFPHTIRGPNHGTVSESS